MKTARTLLVLLAAFGGAVGCQPQEPAKCVCNCEGPIPEGAKVTVESGKPAAAAAAPAAAAAAPAAPAAVPPAPPAPPLASRPTASRASGSVASEPGSGNPVTVSDAEKAEILGAMTTFANAAAARNFSDMKKWTTQRLGESLEKAMQTHAERLYKRTDIFSNGVKAGAPTVAATKDVGDGNLDVEFKFADGQTVNVLMFKEEGKWLFNRL